METDTASTDTATTTKCSVCGGYVSPHSIHELCLSCRTYDAATRKDANASVTDIDFEWLINVVGAAATEEFSAVFSDWAKECAQRNRTIGQIYDTSLVMFAAGYIARRNDELLKKDA